MNVALFLSVAAKLRTPVADLVPPPRPPQGAGGAVGSMVVSYAGTVAMLLCRVGPWGLSRRLIAGSCPLGRAISLYGSNRPEQMPGRAREPAARGVYRQAGPEPAWEGPCHRTRIRRCSHWRPRCRSRRRCRRFLGTPSGAVVQTPAWAGRGKHQANCGQQDRRDGACRFQNSPNDRAS